MGNAFYCLAKFHISLSQQILNIVCKKYDNQFLTQGNEEGNVAIVTKVFSV